MTTATAFKRLGIALAGLFGVGGLVLTVASFLVSADSFRDRVKEEISEVTGLDPVFRGASSVSLFPSGTVTFAGVTLGEGLGEAGEPALVAERLTARLRFFPLLLGHIEIADVALERPVISVAIAANGRSNWAGLIDTLTRAQKPNSYAASFSEIRINEGRVAIRDQSRAINETFENVEASLAWPSISKSFGAGGRLTWHGEVIDATVSVSDFGAALTGSKSGLKLRVASVPLKAAFDGSFSTQPTLKVEGTLAADSASLRDAVRWIGQKPMPGTGFGRFALKSQTNIVGGTIALSGVNVELDGNAAEGVLTFAADGRQTLQGTLATDSLDLGPYVSAIRILTSNQREWSDGRLTLDGLAGLDVDLRLSAAKVALPGVKLGRTAVAANLRNGHLSVTIGEAQAFGGSLKGNIALANLETGVEIKSQLQFVDVALQDCLDQLFGVRRIEGKGNLAVALEGSGDSVLGLTRTLAGSAALTSTQGAISGFDIEQLLRRLERRPLSGGGDFRSGRTPYDRFNVLLKVVQGNVVVDEVRIEGPAVRLTMSGTGTVPTRDIDLKGTASLIAPQSAGGGFDLPFFVTGTWDSPLMMPDPQALISRSGAAAPLLNAVRDRDALRQAIERMDAAPKGPTPVPGQPDEPAKSAQ